MFGETNWNKNGPGRACMANSNESLADNMYCDFEILDPTSELAQAGEEEMEILFHNLIVTEAATLAATNIDPSGTAGITNLVETDSAAFIKALPGGFKSVLENTIEGEKRSQKKRLRIDISKFWH